MNVLSFKVEEVLVLVFQDGLNVCAYFARWTECLYLACKVTEYKCLPFTVD